MCCMHTYIPRRYDTVHTYMIHVYTCVQCCTCATVHSNCTYMCVYMYVQQKSVQYGAKKINKIPSSIFNLKVPVGKE